MSVARWRALTLTSANKNEKPMVVEMSVARWRALTPCHFLNILL